MGISNRRYDVSEDFQTVTDEFGTVLEAPERNELLEFAGHGGRITPAMKAEATRVFAARQETPGGQVAAALPDDADDPFQPSASESLGDVG